jgi:chromosome segregation ATPase
MDSIRSIPASPNNSNSNNNNNNQAGVSVNNIGLSELYNKYIGIVDELRKERKERNLLESYIQQIQREISEKAPVIESKHLQYQRMLTTHTQINNKLGDATRANDELTRERNELDVLNKNNKRIINILKQENDDLARQIRSILRKTTNDNYNDENNDKQLTIGNDNNSNNSTNNIDVSTIDNLIQSGSINQLNDIISEHLVKVTDINSMQLQNQRLLTIVRELSKHNDAFTNKHKRSNTLLIQNNNNNSNNSDEMNDENDNSETTTTQQNNKLTQAHKQIDALKEDRDRLEARVDALATALQLQTHDTLTLTPGAATNNSGTNNNTTHSNNNDLITRERTIINDLQKSYEKLQSDYSTLRDERVNQEIYLQKQLDLSRESSTENKILLATAQNEIKNFKEKYSLLHSNCDSLKQETDLLRINIYILFSFLQNTRTHTHILLCCHADFHYLVRDFFAY